MVVRLEELFLCLNEYSTVAPSTVSCMSLRLLHITDNNLHDWAEVRKFGTIFPALDTLIMANNNLSSIDDAGDTLQRLFPNLRSINLHNAGIRCSFVIHITSLVNAISSHLNYCMYFITVYMSHGDYQYHHKLYI